MNASISQENSMQIDMLHTAINHSDKKYKGFRVLSLIYMP